MIVTTVSLGVRVVGEKEAIAGMGEGGGSAGGSEEGCSEGGSSGGDSSGATAMSYV